MIGFARRKNNDGAWLVKNIPAGKARDVVPTRTALADAGGYPTLTGHELGRNEDIYQMKYRTIAAALAALLLTGSTAALAEGDPVAGRHKAETCMGCHAVPGYFNVYPTYHVPKLGGQSAGYIESALKAYKAGTREHGTMHANAANLSDQDMADIAAFLSSYGK